ncbi:MAG: N-acetylmuramoyl-L-alanine amidase [Parvularculales bacterium]
MKDKNHMVMAMSGFFCLCLMGFFSSAAAEAPTLKDVRIGVHDVVTRFVVEFDGKGRIPWTLFTLADPYRVVIDFPEGERRISSHNKGGGLIKRYRHGIFRAGSMRLVLDTNGPVQIAETLTLPASDTHGVRLVVDLAAGSKEDFLATAGWPVLSSGGEIMRSSGHGFTQSSLQITNKVAQNSGQKTGRIIVPQPAQRITIVIDAGHGGSDPGAIGLSGTPEKKITLAFARELARQLHDQGPYSVVMTRVSDKNISLQDRVEIARRSQADLMVSIHADALKIKSIRGMSVYTLSERASDKHAADLAARENGGGIIAGQDLSDEAPEVRNILIDLVQRDTKNMSIRFAQGLLSKTSNFVRLLPRSHRYAGFYVLKAPDVPSVLVELGFLTNHADEERLLSPRWRRQVASRFVEAVDAYFAKQDYRTY